MEAGRVKAVKRFITMRLDPVLLAWVDAQARVEGTTRTGLVEEGLRLVREDRLGQHRAGARANLDVSKPLAHQGWETCEEFVARWTSDAKFLGTKADSTNQHNAYQVKPFTRDFEGVPLSEVDRPLALAWIVGGTMPARLERYAQRWEGVTRNASGQLVGVAHRPALGAVRAMFTDAMLEGSVASNPFTRLGLPVREGRKRVKPLTASEVGWLAACARRKLDDHAGRVLAAMIVVGAYTGMRPGELYAMEWDWIDWQAGTIRVKGQYRTKTRTYVGHSKNGLQRTIVASEEVLGALRSLPRSEPVIVGERAAEFVFTSVRGRPMSQHTHYYQWKKVAGAFEEHDADGRRLDPYELRHFCGSYLADRGATAQDIAIQLGHKDGGKLAQQLYVHAHDDRTRGRLRDAFTPKP